MPYQVKELYWNNAPCTYGVFPTVKSQFTGIPFVRFGTKPVATFDNELDALNEAIKLDATITPRASGK